MKLIAIEEHFLTPEMREAWANAPDGQEIASFDLHGMEQKLDDLGQGRIALMDEAGVDVQVLSLNTPALHNLEPAESVRLARSTNDMLAGVVAKFPERFQGFATLPFPSPEDAAAELKRTVQQHGFAGALVCGRTRDRNMDHPDFEPILAAAERLRAPLMIHPQLPQRAVRDVYYSGFSAPVDTALSAFALGWHYEAGMQFVRLILAGVFDRYPDLQIILGHWGEVVLFYLERLQSLDRVAKLQRPFMDYVRSNLYVTASGMWSDEYMRRALEIVGPERILFSMDFPYQYKPGGAGRRFVEEAGLSQAEKALFAHGNWERLVAGMER